MELSAIMFLFKKKLGKHIGVQEKVIPTTQCIMTKKYNDQEVLTDSVSNRVSIFSDLTENEDTGTTENSELEPAFATKSESSTNEETACPQDDDTSTRSGVSNDLEFRRISAYVYRCNKKWDQSIKLSKSDRMWKELIGN